MDWKKFATEYLSFSRRDRLAVVSLLLIILGVYLLPSFVKPGPKTRFDSDTSWMAAIRKLEIKQNEANESSRSPENYSPSYPFEPSTQGYTDRYSNSQLFEFDPNTIGGIEWKKLGLREKTIQTIHNYLSKGGRFKRPEDLKKIWGLFPDEYERLAPFIKIEQVEKWKTDFPKGTDEIETGIRSEPGNKEFHYKIIDINSADTSQFISLPGIGSKLAQRIVLFREKLGGFYSVEQVAETYGLQDSAFQKIKKYMKMDTGAVRKININTANVDELKSHPYIKLIIARAIINYRNEHGNFKSIDELGNIMAITESNFQKLKPYLSLN